jgi:hypothetical protein
MSLVWQHLLVQDCPRLERPSHIHSKYLNNILTFRVCPKQFVQLFWIIVCQRWLDVILMSMAIIYFLWMKLEMKMLTNCDKWAELPSINRLIKTFRMYIRFNLDRSRQSYVPRPFTIKTRLLLRATKSKL